MSATPSGKSRAAYIQYNFDPEGFRIVREIKGADGVVLDHRLVSPREVTEIDEALIDEIVDFGIAHFPDLFGNIREMDLEQVNSLRVMLRRMTEALGSLQEYWRAQQTAAEPEPEPVPEPGHLVGMVTAEGSPLVDQTVAVVHESGEYGFSDQTDGQGEYLVENVEVGAYTVTIDPDDYPAQTQSVDVIEAETVRVDFSL